MSLEERREISEWSPSRTKQEFKKECDVHHIMKKFKQVTGQDFMKKYEGYVGGQYGDFSNIPDHRTARDQLNAANAMFMALPAKVRSRFKNDAAEFLDFVHDPTNRDEMIQMGLVDKPKVAKPVKDGSSNPPAG